MSLYRQPTGRRNQQVADVMRYAGHTAVWHQFVSATTGNSVAGIGGVDYYQQNTVSAFFGQYFLPVESERPGAAGQIVVGRFNMVSQFRPGTADEITWDGVLYRVDSDSKPSKLAGMYLTEIQRGDL